MRGNFNMRAIRSVIRVAMLAAVAFTVAVMPAFAQTTGRLVGSIVDAQGAVLPGVTVTVTSPQLQGANTTVTDATGQFRFPALPPGAYGVKAELAGFKTFEENVRVAIDQTITLNLKMQLAGVAETVNVTGVSPVIDTTSAAGGINAGQEMFAQLPVRRDVYSISRLAPGVTQDYYGAQMAGSSSSENQYIIDGLNTTGVEAGTQGKTVNFDFVQEVEVKTGGLSAEYGRLTGGAVNILTKSGGNAFHGDTFGFFEHAQNSTIGSNLPKTATTTTTIPRTADYGVDLGGFLLKDKVWFFGAFDRVQRRDEATVIGVLTSPGSPSVGSVVPLDRTSNLFAAKLTFKASQNHTLIFSSFGDPNTREGNVFAVSGPPSTWQGTLDQGGVDSVGRYEGVFGSRTMLQVQGAQHREKTQYGGAGATTARFSDQTVSPAQNSGGFGTFTNQRFTRNVVKGDLTHYWSSHTIKVGGDWERVDATVNRFAGGAGQQVIKLQSQAGVVYYRHRYYVDDKVAGFSRTDTSTWKIASPLIAEPRTVNQSFYAQDSYKVASGFSLNYGVRWESQNVQDRNQSSAFKLDKNWAPRVGFVWDPTNSGKSKIYANWGRFYENIPMDINIRAFGGELIAFSYNFSPDPASLQPVAGTPSRSSLLGNTIEPVDPELKGQYIDEVLGGFEYEVMPNTTAGVRITRRNLGRVIEDFLVPADGEYFIANPGEGTLGKTLSFYDFVTSAPAPKAERKYTAVELSLRKRYTNNWQFLGSYVWTKLEGNYDGTFQSSTGQLDPNINSAFDYADFMVNAQGPLSGQRTHQIKLDSSYTVASGPADGLNFGGSFHWYSGTPLTAYGYSFGYSNWEYYLTPRGSLGTGPSDWEGDVHIGYPLKVGSQVKANILLDLFNVFNRQGITLLDQRYNLAQNGACAGVPDAICNGDGGLLAKPNSTDPVAQLSNPKGTAPNPDFLKAGRDSSFPTSFTLPRAIRFGVRLTF
jgi:carboxypeptidase family protein